MDLKKMAGDDFDIKDLPVDLQYKVLATGFILIQKLTLGFLLLSFVTLALWFGKLTIF